MNDDFEFFRGLANCTNKEEMMRYIEEHQPRPMTNADHIRVMSDEELAYWLAKTQIANIAEALRIACVPWEQHTDLQELTAKDCLQWLKQPAEGE